MKKRILVSVSNDLSTDQRVRKQCESLMKEGYDIELFGRSLPGSFPLKRKYPIERMSLIFNKGALFYAELNLRLFFKLLFKPANAYWANDLDTLLANFLVARIRSRPLIYDSHEFFTEVPEIQGRPWVKRVWKFLERNMAPRADLIVTVNKSIARLLSEAYPLKQVEVVRNVPERREFELKGTRRDHNLPESDFLLVLQGSGINVDRGAEELLRSLKFLAGVKLLIIGGGDAMPVLQRMSQEEGLSDKIIFKARMPYEEMMQLTAMADLGVSLDKDTNVNYLFSLPNKVFDYFQAGIPVLASNLPEVRELIEKNGAGFIVEKVNPEVIAEKIGEIRSNREVYLERKKNAENLGRKLNWEDEFRPVAEQLKYIV